MVKRGNEISALLTTRPGGHPRLVYMNVGWLVDWGLTSHQQLRSYGDGTSVYSPIGRTGEARDRICDPFT